VVTVNEPFGERPYLQMNFVPTLRLKADEAYVCRDIDWKPGSMNQRLLTVGPIRVVPRKVSPSQILGRFFICFCEHVRRWNMFLFANCFSYDMFLRI